MILGIRRNKFISAAPNIVNVLFPNLSQLFAQSFDVYSYSFITIQCKIHIPYMFVQLLYAEHLFRMLGKKGQHIKFFSCKSQLFAAYVDFSVTRIQYKIITENKRTTITYLRVCSHKKDYAIIKE